MERKGTPWKPKGKTKQRKGNQDPEESKEEHNKVKEQMLIFNGRSKKRFIALAELEILLTKSRKVKVISIIERRFAIMGRTKGDFCFTRHHHAKRHTAPFVRYRHTHL